MASFVNGNTHHIYIPVEPSEEYPGGLRKVRSGEEFEATEGRPEEIVRETPGVVEVGTEEAERAAERLGRRSELIAASGPGAFPAVSEEEFAGRSGIHVTGRDTGEPVGAEAEAAPAVEAEAERSLMDLTVPELRDLAEERGVEVASDARKAEIVAALEEAESGGGTTTSESLPESARG